MNNNDFVDSLTMLGKCHSFIAVLSHGAVKYFEILSPHLSSKILVLMLY